MLYISMYQQDVHSMSLPQSLLVSVHFYAILLYYTTNLERYTIHFTHLLVMYSTFMCVCVGVGVVIFMQYQIPQKDSLGRKSSNNPILFLD